VRSDSYCNLALKVGRLPSFRDDVVQALADCDWGVDVGQAAASVSLLQAVMSENLLAADEANDDEIADEGEAIAAGMGIGAAGPSSHPNGALLRESLAPGAPAESSETAHETARVRIGPELREALQQAIKLQGRGKTKEAESVLQEASAARDSTSDALAKKRASELRDATFGFGNMELTKKAVAKFLEMPEVKRLLPEAVQQGQKEHVDLKTAKVLLNAARECGRNEADRNAFWAGLVALIPADILEPRRGRAAMRILDVN